MDESVRAGALQGFDRLVHALGGESDALIRASGLDPRSLHDPEGMVPLVAVAQLLENAATQFGEPIFGLRLGSGQDLSMLGMLAIVVQTAPTVDQAIVAVSKYLFVHSPSYEVALDNPSRQLPGCVSMRFDVSLETPSSQRQLIDGCLASTYRMVQLLSPVAVPLKGVSIPHTPTGTQHRYRSHFDAPVYVEQPYAALHFAPSFLDIDLRDIQPHLHDQAVAYVASRYPAANGTPLAARVRSTLKSTMGANRGTKGQIASLLGLHPRTLQRHLAAEGVTFEGLREEIYRAATWRLLRDTRIPLGHAAAALGFSEQSAMTRSVRRWYGMTPTQIRSIPDGERQQIEMRVDVAGAYLPRR